jgi:carbamoyltransferase
MKKSLLLGISAYYHDSSVALLKNGIIAYASQEERFSRKKHDASFPSRAIKDLLNSNNINLDDIDKIIFFEKPFLKFERLIETYLAFAPRGFKQFLFSMPIWLKDKLFMKNQIINQLKLIDKNFDEKKIFFSEHHLSHAASAFFPSPFEESLIFTADGVGEWTTTSVAVGKSNQIEIKKEINFPNSLGLLYSAFTYYCGFKVNSGEYKLMGLAPFGKPLFVDKIKKNLIDVKEDGSFRLNQKYFSYSTGFKMTNNNFDKLFGRPRRSPESSIVKFYMNIASSIQNVTEEILLKILLSLKKEFKAKNLCMAGGVALNCVANGLIQKKVFKNIWIQPASGDAGGALGAALAFWHLKLKNKRNINKPDSMNGSFLGPQFKEKEIEGRLKKIGANYEAHGEEKLILKTARLLAKGKAIGWFQGRMEFGPRALGARSILADPRKINMQKQLNLKIKFRESFRPFAPSILEKYSKQWFDLDCLSPYMLLVANLKKNKLLKQKTEKDFNLNSINNLRSVIPGVTHVDNSARVQTVGLRTNSRFYKLLDEFYKITKTPILINTSFNIRGEPIVCTPEDAFRCFMGTDLDILIIGNFILEKSKQKKSLNKKYTEEFELD